ncbi:hypothetical protein A9995_02435 [Erythrobacter sp. QSSC1-22B]|uniref:hypothetical protein n=1 Tax=Erythrobacter sp. QSSC1-22B TaxID=1860125 RepID=UPI000805D688|nr:hypothetical protein [Erythrobacter sp. QSSC1-22B]OBX20584.1 hypothetical protein A9995_02435 [Erythrobacter sp. QSSC1-22B]
MERMAQNFGWIEILFTATVALGFGFYQLWSVSREIARDKAAKEREEGTPESDSPGHPVGEHELDDR